MLPISFLTSFINHGIKPSSTSENMYAVHYCLNKQQVKKRGEEHKFNKKSINRQKLRNLYSSYIGIFIKFEKHHFSHEFTNQPWSRLINSQTSSDSPEPWAKVRRYIRLTIPQPRLVLQSPAELSSLLRVVSGVDPAS